MMKERLRKSIVRAVFIFLWGWLMHYFYIEEGQIDIFKMWLLIGFPFGIYKIHLWLIPKKFRYWWYCWCMDYEYNYLGASWVVLL